MPQARVRSHTFSLGSPRDLAGMRGVLHALLRGRPAPVVADALLIADEIATDSIRAGLPPRTVTVEFTRDVVLIEAGSVEPRTGVAGPDPETEALGRFLLESLTGTWGVRRTDERRTIWATVPFDPSIAPSA